MAITPKATKCTGKILPTDKLTELPANDLELEADVISCLVHSGEFRKRINKIDIEDFYSLYHQKIFTTIRDFIVENKEFSPALFPYSLKHDKNFIAITARDIQPSLHREYLKKLKDISTRRKLQRIAYDLTVRAKEDNDLAMVKSSFIEEAQNINTSFSGRLSRDMEEIDLDFGELLTVGSMNGIKTGFTDLDQQIIGFFPGEFYIIGGIPTVGKSTFMLNIAHHILRKTDKKVLIIEYEMSSANIMSKFVSELLGLSVNRIRGIEGEEDIKILRNINNSRAKISEYNLSILDKQDATVADIEEEIKRIGGVDIVFIDYLQLIRPLSFSKSRYEQITQISKGLKAISMKFSIPMVSIASINRNYAERSDKKPVLSDFRDSGNLEYDCDGALLLYREVMFEEVPKENIEEFFSSAQVIVAKNRYGPSGMEIELNWQPGHSRFTSKERKDY